MLAVEEFTVFTTLNNNEVGALRPRSPHFSRSLKVVRAPYTNRSVSSFVDNRPPTAAVVSEVYAGDADKNRIFFNVRSQ